MDKLLLRPMEAAKMLSIGKTKMYELIRTGEIESIRFGRSIRIPVQSLKDLIEERQGEF